MPHVHNALHHATALQAALQAAVGEQDSAFAGLERAGETLTPVIDLWSLPEWAYLRGEELRWRHVSIAAGAGRSEIQIVNPAASGIVCVVERVRIASDLAYLAGEDLTNILATNDLGLLPRDGRITKVASLIRMRSGNAGGALPTNVAQLLAAGEVWPGVQVLMPGRLLRILGSTNATQLQASIQLRHRLALPGELQSRF